MAGGIGETSQLTESLMRTEQRLLVSGSFISTSRYDPERALYLAVPEAVRISIFEEKAGAVLIEDCVIRLFTFSPTVEIIVQWIPQAPS